MGLTRDDLNKVTATARMLNPGNVLRDEYDAILYAIDGLFFITRALAGRLAKLVMKDPALVDELLRTNKPPNAVTQAKLIALAHQIGVELGKEMRSELEHLGGTAANTVIVLPEARGTAAASAATTAAASAATTAAASAATTAARRRPPRRPRRRPRPR